MTASKSPFILFCLISFSLSAQNERDEVKDEIIENRIESRYESLSGNELENNNLFERLNYYYDHPIELKSGNEDQLRDLSLLTEIQIQNLCLHIKNYGVISNLEELQQVSLFDIETIRKIQPFIKTSADGRHQNQFEKNSHHLYKIRLQRLVQESSGYGGENPAFHGNPLAVYTRYEYSLQKRMEAGFILEKDAGEEIKTDQIRAFDYQSAYLTLTRVKKFSRILIGDYKVSFGQGLTYSSSAGIGKSTEVLLIQKTQNGVSPYKSVSETDGLRGFALVVNPGNFKLTAIYSDKKLDANISSSAGFPSITSFYTGGLHRTEKEIGKKEQVSSKLFGGEILFSGAGFETGLVMVRQELSLPLNDQPELYELFRRNTKGLTNAGFHFSRSMRNYTLFGEFSHSFPGGNALVTGLIFMPDRRISLSLLIRRYDVNYQGLTSGAFGEKSLNQNEYGHYSGIQVKLTENTTWLIYADFFEFPWLQYQISAPSGGFEYLSQISHRFPDGKELQIRGKWKETESDGADEKMNYPLITEEIKKSLRLQLQMPAGEIIRLRSRIEFSEWLSGNRSDQGILVFQELKFSKMQWKWSCVLRFTLFDTESYQSRIYAFEQDVSGAYSIPAFSGAGSKFFVLVNYKWTQNISFGFKIGHLEYDDVESTGSGNDEITGPEKTELKLLCQMKF